MWLLVAREPQPDAAYWPGRRLLAALDALLWPALWIWAMQTLPAPTGVIGPFFTAVAVLCAIGRLRRALWVNHCYAFTTWRWCRVAAALWLMGVVIQLSAQVAHPPRTTAVDCGVRHWAADLMPSAVLSREVVTGSLRLGTAIRVRGRNVSGFRDRSFDRARCE